MGTHGVSAPTLPPSKSPRETRELRGAEPTRASPAAPGSCPPRATSGCSSAQAPGSSLPSQPSPRNERTLRKRTQGNGVSSVVLSTPRRRPGCCGARLRALGARTRLPTAPGRLTTGPCAPARAPRARPASRQAHRRAPGRLSRRRCRLHPTRRKARETGRGCGMNASFRPRLHGGLHSPGGGGPSWPPANVQPRSHLGGRTRGPGRSAILWPGRCADDRGRPSGTDKVRRDA